MEPERDVLGNHLEACRLSPITGFSRNGYCQSKDHDIGVHGVCGEVTEQFLNFTRDRGNDLSSPNELYGFPGLRPGDRWCLYASRWKEAFDHGAAPPVVLSATNEEVLRHVNLDDLLSHANDVKQ